MIVEDGRNWLSYATEPYDVIISEPSNPWISGCSNLFTAEFFQLAKRALTPNGRLLQWIQLYDMHPDGLRSIVRSLRMSFEHVYGFMYSAANNDLMLIATDVPLTREMLPQWDALPEGARADLERLQLYSTADLWSLLTLVTADFDRIAGDAVPNTDDNLLVELRAPYWLNGTDERAEAVASLLLDGATGIVPILEATPGSGFDETVGELACAYWIGRKNTPLAQGIVRLLEARGDTASVALFGAVHDFMRSGYTVAGDVFTRLEVAVQAQPNVFFTRFNRGQIRAEVGQFQQGLDDLGHAVSLRPHHLLALRYRGQALVGVRMVTVAQGVFDRLLSTPLVETQHDLWMLSAHLDMGCGHHDRAIEKLETYARLYPWKGATWRRLAQWHTARKRTEEADDAKRLAALADRNQIRDWIRTALAYDGVGDRERAIAALRKALKIDGKHARTRAELQRLGVDPDADPVKEAPAKKEPAAEKRDE